MSARKINLINRKHNLPSELEGAKSALTNELSILNQMMCHRLWTREERKRYFRLRMEIAEHRSDMETADAYSTFIYIHFIKQEDSRERVNPED